ncbi:MAG: hypothetical protein JRI70_09730 [Deltaproteobacteria bacterium]|nr:hypothetical protein [Deltaproteobacteria bacterium]
MYPRKEAPWDDPFTVKEGLRYWAGYDEWLDSVSMIGDDEKTVCMEVLA